MAGQVSGTVRMASPCVTHSREGTGEGEREEEEVGRAGEGSALGCRGWRVGGTEQGDGGVMEGGGALVGDCWKRWGNFGGTPREGGWQASPLTPSSE